MQLQMCCTDNPWWTPVSDLGTFSHSRIFWLVIRPGHGCACSGLVAQCEQIAPHCFSYFTVCDVEPYANTSWTGFLEMVWPEKEVPSASCYNKTCSCKSRAPCLYIATPRPLWPSYLNTVGIFSFSTWWLVKTSCKNYSSKRSIAKCTMYEEPVGP